MNIRLEDDLYNYVNGDWIGKATIPDDLPATGGFINLSIDVEKIMIDELMNLSSSQIDNKALSNAVKLFNLIHDENKRKEGFNLLLERASYLDKIKTEEDLANNLLYLYNNSYDLPFVFDVSPDLKNATKYAITIGGPSTILPDTTMYDTPSEEMLLGIYKQMCETLLNILNIKDDSLIENALKFDKKISKIVKSREEWADYIASYNPYETSKVVSLIGLDFEKFLTSIFSKLPEQIIVADPKAIENFKDLIKDNISLYTSWAKLKLIVSEAGFISEDLRNVSGIYSRAFMGASTMPNIHRYSYDLVDRCYGEVLGIYYGKKYFGEEAKNDVISIVKNLIETYKHRLTNNTWLSKSTIEKAIVKLDKMVIKIGYPDKADSLFDKLEVLDNDSLLSFILRFRKITNDDNNSKLFTEVDRTKWVMSGNTVNACYNPTSNDITFPAAILRAPFYSKNQSVEENYGGIGCVIGHEISHAFDNNGAQMDEYGNINNWRTESDYKAFKEKTELMIKQFDGLELNNEKVNGTLTVSENIADNGGVASSLETLKRVKRDADLKPFFINFARIWCIKAKPEYTSLLLKVDVHGPAYYRANMQVRNFEEFHETFNIKEGDKMYLPKEDRVIIW